MSVTVTPAMLPLAALRPHAGNVRDSLGDLTELAASIRAQGILQPLVVTPDQRKPGSYVILAGHRRAAAARLAGADRVPVLIRTDTDSRSDQVALMLVENCQRADLSPLEQAQAIAALQGMGRTLAEIARTTGLALGTIQRRLLLLDLPADAQSMVERQTLTLGDAEQLARQVKRTRTGRVVKARAARHLTRTHTLADAARTRCDLTGHPTTGRIGDTACGRCWEDTIRADERGEIDQRSQGFDEVAVVRRADGDTSVPVTNDERREVVRRLHAIGLSDREIAERAGLHDRQVLRDRQRQNLTANYPATRPRKDPRA